MSCDNSEKSVIDSLPVIHDTYVNDTDYDISISWMNGNQDRRNGDAGRIEIALQSAEQFSQTYTYETVDELNLLFSGLSIQVYFDDKHVFNLPQTQSGIDFWTNLPHTKKEQVLRILDAL